MIRTLTLDVPLITGFGDKGIQRLADELVHHVPEVRHIIVPGAPFEKAGQSFEQLTNDVRNALRGFPQCFPIGHSLGCVLALDAACDRQFQGVLGLALVDGPLRPVSVQPPESGCFNAFRNLYETRPAFTAALLEKVAALSDTIRRRILTIGSVNDRVVHEDAKSLDGVAHVRLADCNGHNIEPRAGVVALHIADFIRAVQERK